MNQTCLDLKIQLNTFNQSLTQAFNDNISVATLLKNKSLFIDNCLQGIWQSCGFQTVDQICLISVGGYGREELFLHSDIDILILHVDASLLLQDKIELFLQTIWDLHLSIGHSVRDFKTCLKEAQKDAALFTNLLQMRYVCGNKKLFHQFHHDFHNKQLWTLKKFLAIKLNEAHERQTKYPLSEMQYEPDIKNSFGGLRDLQLIIWLTFHFFKTNSLSILIEKKFLQSHEYDLLIRTRDFLWKIRYALHILNRRNQNRLLTRDKNAIAQLFASGVENFMQRYFITVDEATKIYKKIINQFMQYGEK